MAEVEPVDSAPSARPSGYGRRSSKKSAEAFRTISEVSEELSVPQHVLRFWETKFAVIKPMKRGGGRRYYRPEDITLLRGIRDLLYVDGYTIKGVQKLLREGGVKVLTERATADDTDTQSRTGGSEAGYGASGTVSPANAESGGMDRKPVQAKEASPAHGQERAALSALLDELTEMRNLLRAAIGRAD